MVESELGEIPEGWEVKTLSEMINIIGGGTPNRSIQEYWNGDIPWFSIKDLPNPSDVFVIDTDEKITTLGLKKSSTKLLPVNTTIITARGTVGKLALIDKPMCMNQSCYGITGANNIEPIFNYFNLKEAITTLQRNTHGAVFDTITTKTFESYSSAFCGELLASKFDQTTKSLLEKIKCNLYQIKYLAELRDSLLPKLLSGEIDLSEIQSEVA
jgi:type I restriction enzyme, S subunit